MKTFMFCILQYLGCIEVFESRGMQVCEEAVKALKSVSIQNLYVWELIVFYSA